MYNKEQGPRTHLKEDMTVNMTAVAIVAIIGWVIVSLADSRKNKKKLETNSNQKELESQIATLKERVATLEKIVCDESYDLKKQFKDLEQDRVA